MSNVVPSSRVVEETTRGNVHVTAEMSRRVELAQSIANQAMSRNARISTGDYADTDVRDDVISRALGLAIDEIGHDPGDHVTIQMPFLLTTRDQMKLPELFFEVFDSYAEYDLGEYVVSSTRTNRHVYFSTITVKNIYVD